VDILLAEIDVYELFAFKHCAGRRVQLALCKGMGIVYSLELYTLECLQLTCVLNYTLCFCLIFIFIPFFIAMRHGTKMPRIKYLTLYVKLQNILITNLCIRCRLYNCGNIAYSNQLPWDVCI
jgi:hypothetical protein